MINLRVSDMILLKQLGASDGSKLFALVDKNRQRLREYLPWLDKNTTQEDSVYFINDCQEIFDKNGAVNFGIFFEEKLVGLTGYHPLDNANKIGSIGYWIDSDHSGQGIMTKATQAVIDFGFKDLKLNRIEIRCAVHNVPSNAVAKKLKFKFEGTLRQVENLYGKYVDHNVYSFLSNESKDSCSK